LGAAIAAELARAGATVVVNYATNDMAAKQVIEQVESSGGQALLLRCDVRDFEGLIAGVQRAEAAAGPVSVLVHNAGARLQPAKFTDVPWEDFQLHLDVSLRGAVNCCRACVPGMSARRRGAIIFVASAAAHAVPPPQWSSYVAAKAALVGLMRSLAVELGPLGIRVNAVSPGMTPTDLTAFMPDRMKQVLAQQAPLRRLATAAEVAAAVTFLASDDAGYLSGVALPVAGGTVMA
jgi:NAD(P)-dependent dehydrogenase (short-subunit alcohol dehydrogenase family)